MRSARGGRVQALIRKYVTAGRHIFTLKSALPHRDLKPIKCKIPLAYTILATPKWHLDRFIHFVQITHVKHSR